MRKLSLVLASLMAVAFTFATLPAKAGSHAIEACLITKTDINPFFVKMKEGAKAKADELGIKLSTFAGKSMVIMKLRLKQLRHALHQVLVVF